MEEIDPAWFDFLYIHTGSSVSGTLLFTLCYRKFDVEFHTDPRGCAWNFLTQ